MVRHGRHLPASSDLADADVALAGAAVPLEPDDSGHDVVEPDLDLFGSIGPR